MKLKYKFLLLIPLAAIFITGCENSERQKASGEKLTGATQETVGNLTDNSELKKEGKGNETKGNLRNIKEDVKDLVTGD